jgi:high-affinity Fe2+/Pb2+ permease
MIMSYRFVPVATGPRHARRRRSTGTFGAFMITFGKWVVFYPAVITFAIVFILHGGLFIMIAAGIVWRLVMSFRRGMRMHAREVQQRAAQQQAQNWNPRNPYDNI